MWALMNRNHRSVCSSPKTGKDIPLKSPPLHRSVIQIVITSRFLIRENTIAHPLFISDENGPHIIPRDYVKPNVQVGNYYFEWSKDSYGVPRREESNLKAFIRDVLPYIESLYPMVNGLEQTISNARKPKQHQNKRSFSPRLHLSYANKNYRYDLLMSWDDGSTLISRTEEINFVDNVTLSNNSDSHARMGITWTLGELMFDRHKRR